MSGIDARSDPPAGAHRVVAPTTIVNVNTGGCVLVFDVQFEGGCDSASWSARVTGANPADKWVAGAATIEIIDKHD